MWNWYAGASSLGGYSAGRNSGRLRERKKIEKKIEEKKKQVWTFVGHGDDIPSCFPYEFYCFIAFLFSFLLSFWFLFEMF